MRKNESGLDNLMIYRDPFSFWVILVILAYLLGLQLLVPFAFAPNDAVAAIAIGIIVVTFIVLMLLPPVSLRECIVDRERETATIGWRLFFPHFRRTVSLQRYRWLLIHRYVKTHRYRPSPLGGTRIGRTVYYALDLYAATGSYVRLGHSLCKSDICSMAHAIGAFACLDVLDATGDQPDVRQLIQSAFTKTVNQAVLQSIREKKPE